MSRETEYVLPARMRHLRRACSPCSEYELEMATHLEELPVPHYTWVRIMGAQMGVGGDDSWGRSRP